MKQRPCAVQRYSTQTHNTHTTCNTDHVLYKYMTCKHAICIYHIKQNVLFKHMTCKHNMHTTCNTDYAVPRYNMQTHNIHTTFNTDLCCTNT